MPAPPSPPRRRLLAGGLALLVVTVLVTVAALLPGSTEEPGGPPAAGEVPGPVLLVPGYGGSTGSLRALADRLAADGRDTTVVPPAGDGTGDLAASAAELAGAADAALARTGAGSVDVVGYSAGGLVARLWVADGGAGVARRVVTLGTPHHGTTLADLARSLAPERCPEGCRQMATDSPLLAALNAGDETPDGPDWVSIWTERDETVTPPETARLDGALNVPVQSVCADAQPRHGELPADPLVLGLVSELVGAGDPAPPTAADCDRLRGAPAGG